MKWAVIFAMLIVGCDAAKQDFGKCTALESKDPGAALAACETAIKKAADTESGKAAAAKIPTLKATVAAIEKKRVEEAEKARIARAKAERERWKALPNKLKEKIRKQGMWDLGRGTVTRAIDVIIGEAGQPTANYESSFGAMHNYVWGARLGDSVTTEQIRNTPFNVRILRDLACGDFGGSEIEFYSYGERI